VRIPCEAVVGKDGYSPLTIGRSKLGSVGLDISTHAKAPQVSGVWCAVGIESGRNGIAEKIHYRIGCRGAACKGCRKWGCSVSRIPSLVVAEYALARRVGPHRVRNQRTGIVELLVIQGEEKRFVLNDRAAHRNGGFLDV